MSQTTTQWASTTDLHADTSIAEQLVEQLDASQSPSVIIPAQRTATGRAHSGRDQQPQAAASTAAVSARGLRALFARLGHAEPSAEQIERAAQRAAAAREVQLTRHLDMTMVQAGFVRGLQCR